MQTTRWTPVLDAAALVDGTVQPVFVGDRPLVLVRQGEVVRALAGICPHDHAPLAGGRVEGDELVCPRHGARFHVADGICGAGFKLPALRCYPVRVRRGRVEVDGAAVERDPPGMEVQQRWDLTRR